MSGISNGTYPPTSVYEYVEGQLSRLISRFGLEGQRKAILRTYQLICANSLSIPLRARPPSFSRINEDGTPFQFSVALGSSKPPLQFLSEAATPGDCPAARLHANRQAICDVAHLFAAQEELSWMAPLIEEMVPGNDADLLADPSGAIWIGASFIPEEAPRLKIYLNARWGPEADQWKRLDTFACHFNAAHHWHDTKAQLNNEMQPLGVSISICRDRISSGRIYLSAYGRPMVYYEALAKASTGKMFQDSFRPYTEILLGENRSYPTQSVVCSFGFDESGSHDFKFEMCALRIFQSDAEAMTRCSNWLELQKIEPYAYLNMMDELSTGRLHGSMPHLHSYLGIGGRQEHVYSTFYFNPAVWNA